MEGTLQRLADGADFAALAEEVSEDARTKKSGGDLGWMQKERMLKGLQEPAVAAEVGKPILLQSKIGWHIFEVLERREARERTYEEARRDVLAALEAVKRKDGLTEYRKKLRERDKKKVEIFKDVLERDLAAGPAAPPTD